MKLTCDLCGGSLEMKNGSAVCQDCGLTYSMETLREKMGKPAQTPAEAPVSAAVATSTVRDASAHHTNLLNLAVLEFNNKNYAKAISTCDQVLASDYANKDAWQLKIRSSNVKAGVGAYQAYYASQQTKEGREQAVSFGKSHFASQKLGDIDDQKALLTVFPELANEVANKSIENSLSEMNKKISEIRSGQDWEKRNKPSSEHQENEKTMEARTKISDRIRWLDDYLRYIEAYHSFSKLENSDIDANLIAYCDAIVTWIDLVLDFKRWEGEYHHRETVSVYTTKYYYHKYKLIPLFYDTSWEYGACMRTKTAIKTVRSEAARRNETKIAQRVAAENKRIADYWLSHPEEKQELDAAKAELEEKVNKLRKNFKTSEEVLLVKALEEELESLQTQRNSLGLFSFKEKKVLNEQISSKETEIMRAKKICEELEYQNNNQIKDLQSKILKINDRLKLVGVKPKL